MTKRRFRLTSLLIVSAVACFAQQSASAGGRWIRLMEPGKTNGTPIAAFVLAANAEDPDRHPAISITCPDPSKPPLVVYDTDVPVTSKLLDPMNYYSPAIPAAVKVDDAKAYKTECDIVPAANEKEQKRVLLDRKTFHRLLTGSTMRVRFSDRNDVSYLDEFSVGGLNLNDVRAACGDKWFGQAISRRSKELAP